MISLISLTLVACTSVDPIEVRTVYEEKPYLDLADPTPLKPKGLKWFVITPDNAEDVFADMKVKQYDLVLFGLTDEGYKDLSQNYLTFRNYILEQRQILKSYRDYYEPNKEDILE